MKNKGISIEDIADIVEQDIEQVMKTINMLHARLLNDERIKDLERSVSDSAYQEQLLAEFFHE